MQGGYLFVFAPDAGQDHIASDSLRCMKHTERSIS